MSTSYLGQITMFVGNFAPRGTALCNGQLISLSQNTALFALLGTSYGGDGRTTFALPDLRSRLPVHQGQGAGLSSYTIGQVGGTSTVTLTQAMIPAHSHTFNATTTTANSPSIVADSSVPATPGVSGGYAYAGAQSPPNPPLVPQTLAPQTCGFAGGSQPHSNLMPSLGISFIISLQGIFPSRN